MSEPSARLRSLIESLVEAEGLFLFDLEQSSGKLTVTVDSPGGDGADMAAISDVTKAVSRALDAEDPIAGKYLLEVTSPGVERPLRTPAHFRWAVGKEVTVRRHPDPDQEGERRLTGVLRSADDDGITLEAEGGGPVTLAYDDIQRARTVFDFDAELRAHKHKPASSGPSGKRNRKAG
jgi:ribosome maturation factor RimP